MCTALCRSRQPQEATHSVTHEDGVLGEAGRAEQQGCCRSWVWAGTAKGQHEGVWG